MQGAARRDVRRSMLTVTLNPALDVCAYIPVVQPDRKMHCSKVTIDSGGGGINVARVAVRMGAAARAVTFLDPASSEQFVQLLAAEDVPLEVISASGPLRESFTVTETSTGRQYRFVLPGPRIDSDDFDTGMVRIAELCVGEALVVVSGSCPPGVSTADVARLVDVVRAGGAEAIVDISGDMLGTVAAAGVRLIKPSVHELSVCVGEELNGNVEIERAARRLLASGPTGAILVSLGAAGALLVRVDAETVWLHAPHVRPVSTVGAGDSLVAGLAVALQRGATLVDAARLGVAAGSAATLATGTGLCQTTDIQRLLPQVLVSALAT